MRGLRPRAGRRLACFVGRQIRPSAFDPEQTSLIAFAEYRLAHYILPTPSLTRGEQMARDQGGRSKSRRNFCWTLVVGFVASGIALAQNATKMRRIGWLSSQRPSEYDIQTDLASLQQLGWIEGRNIIVERRFTGSHELLPAAAQELVRMNVDLIVTDGTPATLAAKKATATIPIVMAGAGDPVAMGLVASLAHPGGNVTGYSMVSTELEAKRAELLHELAPTVQRVALPIHPDNPTYQLLSRQAEAAYRSLGVQAIFIDPESVKSFLDEAVRQRAQAVDGNFLWLDTDAAVAAFVERALHYRLPIMSMGREVVEAGGLVSFDTDDDEADRRVAVIIDKILHGAKPADIPVEQPTRFHLILNLKSAKALGLTIPKGLLLRADEVIQ
jgi:putative tryptophan/tyrosine transport system substrate-binding protein